MMIPFVRAVELFVIWFGGWLSICATYAGRFVGVVGEGGIEATLRGPESRTPPTISTIDRDDDGHDHAKSKDDHNNDSSGGPVVDLKAPQMGFMSWERFRCQVDCDRYPKGCINRDLYVSMADALVLGGYAQVGYRQVSIDDCWMANITRHHHGHGHHHHDSKLQANSTRFLGGGIKWLRRYLHAQGLTLGLYADAGIQTCGHYPGSQGYELLDAQTFADWGVDYLKLDGCHIQPSKDDEDEQDKYAKVYGAWGKALKSVAWSNPIVLSCSWPAYIGDDESIKPYQQMYEEAGCNTWRNYRDVDNRWASVKQIILHWADYWFELQQIPDGAFNDADMLLAGDDHYNHYITLDQARLQMGFWCMIASPLFIGGDVRTIPADYREILVNQDVIAINQDPSRKQADCVRGCKGTPAVASTTATTTTTMLSSSQPIQVWSKSLQNGESRALAFLNLHDDGNHTATNIAYNYTVEGAIARCIDLWSDDPQQDVCNRGQGDTTKEWITRLLPPTDSNNNDKVILQIKARDVPPTSHRLLRIDYFCNNNNNNNNNDDGVDCTSTTTTDSY